MLVSWASPTKRHGSDTFKPCLEPLEDRLALSTFTTPFATGSGNVLTSPVFATLRGVTSLSISSPQDQYGHAHSGTVQLTVELHNPTTNQWTVVQSVTRSSYGQFHYNGLVVNFPAQTVDQFRLNSSPYQSSSFHTGGEGVGSNTVTFTYGSTLGRRWDR